MSVTPFFLWFTRIKLRKREPSSKGIMKNISSTQGQHPPSPSPTLSNKKAFYYSYAFAFLCRRELCLKILLHKILFANRQIHTFLPTLAKNPYSLLLTVVFPYYQSGIIKNNFLIRPGIKEPYFAKIIIIIKTLFILSLTALGLPGTSPLKSHANTANTDGGSCLCSYP